MPDMTWGDIVNKAEKEGGFELIDPATYDWQITGASFGYTSTDKPRIRAKCVILSGPNAGKSAWKDLVFEEDPSVMSIRVQELQALGVDPGAYSGDLRAVVEQIAPALVNRSFNAQLTHRPWQGQMRNNIGIFQELKAGASPTAPTVPAVATPGPGPTPESSGDPMPPSAPGPDEAPF